MLLYSIHTKDVNLTSEAGEDKTRNDTNKIPTYRFSEFIVLLMGNKWKHIVRHMCETIRANKNKTRSKWSHGFSIEGINIKQCHAKLALSWKK